MLQAQAEYYRHYRAAATSGGNMLRIYQQYAKRFPQDMHVAYGWLETATDYGKPEEMQAGGG